MNGAASDHELAAQVVAEAVKQGLRVATAESLTGGLLADALVKVPGASRVFSGGVVAYDTALKARLLGVDRARLDLSGPVHCEVARQMARGVRELCAVPVAGALRPADIGLATTGVAGPDPDPQTGQLPGTVWICLNSDRGDYLEGCMLEGSRDSIRRAVVHRTLRLLLKYLSHVDSSSGKFQEYAG